MKLDTGRDSRRFIQKIDALYLVLLLLMAGSAWYLFYFNAPAAAEARVFVGQKIVMRIALRPGQAERELSVPHTAVKLRLTSDGGIAFASSDCPDKICVRSGVLRFPGQSAACLPNRVVIRLFSTHEAERAGNADVPDMVSGGREAGLRPTNSEEGKLARRTK